MFVSKTNTTGTHITTIEANNISTRSYGANSSFVRAAYMSNGYLTVDSTDTDIIYAVISGTPYVVTIDTNKRNEDGSIPVTAHSLL